MPQAEKVIRILHVNEVRPRKDHRGVDLISDALPFGRLWYDGPNAVTNAIGYAMHDSRSHDAVNSHLLCGGEHDCDARAQRRFQRMVKSYSHHVALRAKEIP